jgi:hypothetical protein
LRTDDKAIGTLSYGLFRWNKKPENQPQPAAPDLLNWVS